MKKILKLALKIFAVYLLLVVLCLLLPPLFRADGTEKLSVQADGNGSSNAPLTGGAAERGVHVQILIDGINGELFLKYNDHFRELVSKEQVEVKLYNPINLLKPWEINYRMHDKYLIADDFAYILGGRNTDDLFLGHYVENYNEDRDVLVYETVPGQGSSYQQLQTYFEQMWDLDCMKPYHRTGKNGTYLAAHYERVKEKYPQAFVKTDWLMETIEANSIELCTNEMKPNNKKPLLWNRMVEEMKRETDILVQTPYIICSKPMYQDLADITADGAKLTMIINAVENGANPFGCTDYLNHKDRVLAAGSGVCEFAGNRSLHTKAVLAGDQISILGSCNLDIRSVYLDTEMMLIIDSPELNSFLRRELEGLKAESRYVSPDGMVAEGSAFEPITLKGTRKIIYGILRILIVPIRHLL